MIESAVGKLLHAPTTRLKERAADGEDARELAAADALPLRPPGARRCRPQLEAAPAESETDERLPN